MIFLIPIILIVIIAAIITVSYGGGKKSVGKKSESSILKRTIENPIMKPRAEKNWESEAVFNAGAVKVDGRVNFLYRAVGADGVSRIGYAASKDGIHIDERSAYPVFVLENPRVMHISPVKKFNPVLYPSGGSWGGCEDPRLVNIDGTIYMTFNAFDGWDFIRIGVTSISEDDLKLKRWNWKKPMLISPVCEVNKNWVLFPEKINGKFAILHSMTPEIQIDYVERLEDLESGAKKIKSQFGQKVARKDWDTWVRGVGPPPIKTKEGWLVFYHAISKGETHRYKLGVVLLDLKNPKKVIARAPNPILMPDMWYENTGKPGVIYACGAIMENGVIHIYYGGGDKYVCMAKTTLKEIMNFLKKKNSRPIFDFSR